MEKRIGEVPRISKCPRCKQAKENVNFMWDLIIDGKQEMGICICEDCDKMLKPRPCLHEWCKYTDDPCIVVCADCGKQFHMITRKPIEKGSVKNERDI